MVTLGSYRLGIVSPSSDIDLLCIGHLKHNQFLHDASNFFQQSNSEFKDVVLERVVSIAIAPLLKFKVFGFEVVIKEVSGCYVPIYFTISFVLILD